MRAADKTAKSSHRSENTSPGKDYYPLGFRLMHTPTPTHTHTHTHTYTKAN